MKKNSFILLIATFSILIGAGYYPDYGPAEEWSTIESTSNAFIIFDSITINGIEIVSGTEGGAAGSCDGNDCDILSAVYNPGRCIGTDYEGICVLEDELQDIYFETQCNEEGFCSIDDYESEEVCISSGSCSIDDYESEEVCISSGSCSIDDYESEEACNNSGSCSNVAIDNKDDCQDDGAEWTPAEWTSAEWTPAEWTPAEWTDIWLITENDCNDIDGNWVYQPFSIGWTYAPVINNGITLGIQLNDGLTTGLEYYPSVNAAFEPTVTFNLFDASEGVMYYNIASSVLELGSAFLFGPLDISGDGEYQSSNGFQYGEPTIFPLGDDVCNTVSGIEGDYINFSSFGGSGDVALCGYSGCMDVSAENYDSSAVEDDGSCEYAGCTDASAINYDPNANINNDSCGYAGCNDPTAGNIVENGENYSGQLYDCSGNAGIFDMSCCQFQGCNVEGATNNISTSSDCSGEPDGTDDSCCTFSPIDISASYSVVEETVNSINYSTTNVELLWNESSDCSSDTEWTYIICLENSVNCDTTASNSIVYDIGWNNTINYSLFTYGCALDIYGELYGSEFTGAISSSERPFPSTPGEPTIIDNSGEGFVELQWEESHQVNYYKVLFTNVNDLEDTIEFIASDDSTATLLNYENGNVNALFYPLGAGKTYHAKISANNLNSLNEVQESQYSGNSENIIVMNFPEDNGNGFMAIDTVAYPFSIELTWDSAPQYGTYPQEWNYEIFQTGVGFIYSTNETFALISGLQTLTLHEFQIVAKSGYGEIQGELFSVMTTADGDGADWGFQVIVSHLGYGYMPVFDENNFFGFAEEASNHYDNALDIVEPPAAADYVKFYFVREDWEEEQIGWGSQYTQEIRSRHDEDYAKENYSENDLAVFNGQLISNMPGFTTLKFDLINFYGDAPVNSDNENFCPVYLKLNAYDEVKYYKIEDGTEITIQINGLTEYDMELIVGNIIPDAIPNFNGFANNTHVDPLNIRPEINLFWDDNNSCENENGVDICNSVSSRYPSINYLIEFNDGTNDLELESEILTYNHTGVGNLSYETNYGFTLSGLNNSGKGISTQIDVETSSNIPPTADAGGFYDEECTWNEYGCGNVYLTPHDGDPNSSIVEVTLHGSGYDPDGLGLRFYWQQISGDSIANLSENSSIQSLLESAFYEPTFEAGLALNLDPLVFEFELAVTDTFPLGLAQYNGFDIDRDTVIITVLPESNQSPMAYLDVTRTYDSGSILVESVDFLCMDGDTIIYNIDENTIISNEEECSQTDGTWIQQSVNDFLNWNWEAENEIGPIWQVPHDGNPYTNFANIQLVNKSFDLDGGESFIDENENNTFDEGEIYNDINFNGIFDHQLDVISTLWNRTTTPETFLDANGNGVFDYGEPFNDINNNGYYDWSEAINLDTLTTRSHPGVDTVQIFIEDSYGYTDTSQMVILILDEPNEVPEVYAGSDTIVFIEPEYESTYDYVCTDSNFACYPSITDADNNGDIIVDTLNFYWQDGSSELDKVFELPEGDHQLTLCANDPYGAQDCDSKIITVYQEPLPDKIDNFSSYEDLYFIELTWTASDLSSLSDDYSSLVTDESLLNNIELYPFNLNASHYEIYRDGELLNVVARNDNDQIEFRYIDNGLNPATTYNYKIIPLNSHGRQGLESDLRTIQTTSVPTIRVTSPNGTEIWASSYFDENFNEVVQAFPLTWEMTSVQNIRKINIFVSHDNGESWNQAENFYAKNITELCSFEGVAVEDCPTTGLGGIFNNPMSCEAMGNKWSYGGIDSCFAQVIESNFYSEFVSSQDIAVQNYTGDELSISPQINFSLDLEPLEIFNQGDIFTSEDIVSDETYIKGEGIEINHNTLVKMVVFDRGDYYDISNEIPPQGWSSAVTVIEDISDGAFTLSSNKVTRIFDIGWHLFGPPVKPYIPRMFDAFQEPHGFGDWGYDWIAFAQSGSFSDLYMQMGYGYYLNNTSVGNLTIYGDPVTNDNFFDYNISDIVNDNYSVADIKIQKGWNLISNSLVRPISKYNFEVIHLEDNSTYTFDQAVGYGFIQPSIYGFDNGYYTTNSIYPFEGYFWHAARGDMLLKIRPHDFSQLSMVVEKENWELSINASLSNIEFSDQIIIGMGENATDGFKYGEDEIELPKFLGNNPVDLVIEESWIGVEDENGNIAESNLYYSNIKKSINVDQSQIWKINFKNEHPESLLKLSWNFSELNNEIGINLYFEGNVINMRANNHTSLNTQVSGSFIVVVGRDPLLSNLGVPFEFSLGRAYPNPFNPITNFKLELSEDGLTNISIFNIAGQLIKEVYSGIMKAGYHQLQWNATNFPSGLYLLKVEQGKNIGTQKILLIK